MATITGLHICCKCINAFQWKYHVRRPAEDGDYSVETIDNMYVPAKRLNSMTSDEYELGAYCPYCDEFNIFVCKSHISEV